MSEIIRFSVPLPPVSLRSNNRAHWAQRKKDADAYATAIDQRYGLVWGGVGWDVIIPAWESLPWQKAHVLYVWKYAGTAPDHSNLGGNTKHLQDILCVAPKLGVEQSAKYDRWHLGLIENDAGIVAEYRAEKVAHRADEEIDIVIERRR